MGPEPEEDGEVVEEVSIADQVRKAAEEVIQRQGMVYEETSGLYYDYNSGYYYDANKKMYYDGQKGVYLRFNYETNEYERLNSDNVVIGNSSSSPSTISDNSDQSTIDDSHSIHDKKE